MAIGQDSLEVISPSAVCHQLADLLITFSLKEELIAMCLSEVHAACFFCIVHIEEDLRYIFLDESWRDIEGGHSQSCSQDKTQVNSCADLI